MVIIEMNVYDIDELSEYFFKKLDRIEKEHKKAEKIENPIEAVLRGLDLTSEFQNVVKEIDSFPVEVANAIRNSKKMRER